MEDLFALRAASKAASKAAESAAIEAAIQSGNVSSIPFAPKEFMNKNDKNWGRRTSPKAYEAKSDPNVIKIFV